MVPNGHVVYAAMLTNGASGHGTEECHLHYNRFPRLALETPHHWLVELPHRWRASAVTSLPVQVVPDFGSPFTTREIPVPTGITAPAIDRVIPSATKRQTKGTRKGWNFLSRRVARTPEYAPALRQSQAPRLLP